MEEIAFSIRFQQDVKEEEDAKDQHKESLTD